MNLDICNKWCGEYECKENQKKGICKRMRRDEDWFDAVGKNDWRQEQIEKREKDRLAQANVNTYKSVEFTDGVCPTHAVPEVRE